MDLTFEGLKAKLSYVTIKPQEISNCLESDEYSGILNFIITLVMIK